jgi:putative addiction module CopG family antidote
MDIALTPALERLISAKVASGQYETASEVVREALRFLENRDRAREQLRATSRRALTSWLGVKVQPTRVQVGNSPSGSSRAVVRRVPRSGRWIRYAAT